MCCSLEHYPKGIGLWETDSAANHIHPDHKMQLCTGKYDHLHIVLPGGLETFCAYVNHNNVYFRSNDFGYSPGEYRVDKYLMAATGPLVEDIDLCLKMRDIVTIGVSESHSFHKEWLEELLDKFATEHNFLYQGIRWTSSNLRYKGIFPPEPLEWHEWLIRQAEREIQEKKEVMRYVDLSSRTDLHGHSH